MHTAAYRVQRIGLPNGLELCAGGPLYPCHCQGDMSNSCKPKLPATPATKSIHIATGSGTATSYGDLALKAHLIWHEIEP
jgi:hypothetical protein